MKRFIRSKSDDGCINLLDCSHSSRHYKMVITNTGIEKNGGGEVKDTLLTKRQQHSHPVYHIILFSEGNYHYFHNNSKIFFKPGMLTVTSPGEMHKFGPVSVRDPNSYHFLTFCLEDSINKTPLSIPFRQLLEIYTGEKLQDAAFPVDLGKRHSIYLENAIVKITEMLNSGKDFSNFSAGLLLLEVFKLLINDCFSSRESKFSTVGDISSVEKAKNYIEKHFTEQITISKISSIAALAPNYFIRKFKEEYRITPVNYQIELKINAAKTLLKTTNYQVKRVAGEVGFRDIYYFSRQFKKTTGMSPGKFRAGKPD